MKPKTKRFSSDLKWDQKHLLFVQVPFPAPSYIWGGGAKSLFSGADMKCIARLSCFHMWYNNWNLLWTSFRVFRQFIIIHLGLRAASECIEHLRSIILSTVIIFQSTLKIRNHFRSFSRLSQKWNFCSGRWNLNWPTSQFWEKVHFLKNKLSHDNGIWPLEKMFTVFHWTTGINPTEI